MKLTELIEQITPLPWRVRDSNVLSGEHTVMVNPRAGSKEWVEQGQLTIKYACHAANLLPELVKALEDCAESLGRLEDKEGAYRVTCLQQARQILARAQEVKP